MTLAFLGKLDELRVGDDVSSALVLVKGGKEKADKTGAIKPKNGNGKLILDEKEIQREVEANKPVLPSDLSSFSNRREWVRAMKKYIKDLAEYEEVISEVDIIRPSVRLQCDRVIRDEAGNEVLDADGKPTLVPCPFVSCRHHLFLEVDPKTGNIKYVYPELAGPEEMDPNACCALDIVQKAMTLQEDLDESPSSGRLQCLSHRKIGEHLGVIGPRIKQIQDGLLMGWKPDFTQLKEEHVVLSVDPDMESLY